MKTQHCLICLFVGSIALHASNLIEDSLKTFPPGSIDRITTQPAGEFHSTTEVSLGEFTPAEPDSEISRLLKAIQDRKSGAAIMPGTQAPTLENLLLVELAREVIRLKEENRKLSIQIDALKNK